jgi:ABC-type branched-subunit amino acid transport system permease subunit
MPGVCAFALGAMSIVVITGWTGQISLAQVALMAFSVFIFGLMSGFELTSGHTGTFAWPVGVLLAVLITTIFAMVVALPALRIRGLHFAVISLAVAYTIDVVVFTEGSIVPRQLQGLRIDGPGLIHRPLQFALFSMGVVGLAWVGLNNLRRSSFGRALMAVRDGEVASGVLGIDVVRAKVLAFALAGMVAAVGGILFGWKLGGVTETARSLSVDRSIFLLALVVISGMRSLNGAIIAGFLATYLPEYVARVVTDATYATVVAGLGVIVLAIALPEGLVTLPAALRGAKRRLGSRDRLASRGSSES